MKTMVRDALAGALMLSATVLAPAPTAAPALAQGLQGLKDSKCTGRPGIPWDEQIAGCTKAIKSGRYTGKDLVVAFISRGAAHRAKGDLERAIQDYDQAIKLNPNEADAFYYRGIARGMRGETGPAIQDFTRRSSSIQTTPSPVQPRHHLQQRRPVGPRHPGPRRGHQAQSEQRQSHQQPRQRLPGQRSIRPRHPGLRPGDHA